MKEILCYVRIKRHGEFANTYKYYVDIPNHTPEDEMVKVLMDTLRPDISDDFEGDEDWEDGNIDWELNDWEEY